jgi:Mce-associated membrane protein
VAADRAYDALMPADVETGTPRRSARGPVLVGVAALVIAITGASLAAASTRQLSHRDDLASMRQQALAAARQIAVDFSAYDYRHLQQDFNRVLSESTGSFKSQFATQSAGVQDVIVKVKAVSTAEVASAGVVSAGPRGATVLVAVNRTVTNTSAPHGQSDSFGLQIVLTHLHGRWLASLVKPL